MPDQRIQYTEELVGAGHPTKADTLNRLTLVEHREDGTHGNVTINDGLTLSPAVWPAFSAVMSANQGIPNNTWLKLAFDTEEYDTNNNYDNTNYRFQPTVAGKYLLTAGILMANPPAVDQNLKISIYKNGSKYRTQNSHVQANTQRLSANIAVIVDANGSSDYFEAYAYWSGGNSAIQATDAMGYTYFQGIRIG